MESVNKSDAYKSKYLNLNTKHQKAEDASGITSVANQSFSNVKNRIESDMNKVASDVETQYQVTGGDGDNDTSMSGLEKALAIGTAVASMGATVLGAIKGDSSGGNQNNNNDAKPLTTSQNLDKLTAAYESNKSSKNKAALELGLNKARGEFDSVNGQIKAITTENGALEKAANGQFNEVLGQIKEGAKECAATKATADKKVESCNKDISEITKQKAENGECKINVEKLSDETKAILGKTEGEVEIKVNQEGKQKATLEELQGQFDDYQGKVNTADNETIQNCEKAVNDAQSGIDKANEKLSNAEKMEVTKDGKEDKELVKSRNKAIKDAKKEVSDAEGVKKAKEKALKEAQEQREKDHTAMMDVAGNISVGEKTLADIVKAKEEAQQQASQAQKQIDNYANQLKGYIDADKTLEKNKESVQQNKTENEKLINILEQQNNDYSNLVIDKEKGQATAKAKLDANQTKLTSLQTRQSELTASIGKAEIALGTPATDNDASTKTEDKTKEKTDAKLDDDAKTDAPAGNPAATEDGTYKIGNTTYRDIEGKGSFKDFYAKHSDMSADEAYDRYCGRTEDLDVGLRFGNTTYHDIEGKGSFRAFLRAHETEYNNVDEVYQAYART